MCLAHHISHSHLYCFARTGHPTHQDGRLDSTCETKIHFLFFSRISTVYTHTDRHTSINATRFSIQLVNAFAGLGNQLYIGFGGAVFIRTYSLSQRRVQWNPSTRWTYTIAGTGVSSSNTRAQNLVVTKGGITRYMFNKTDGTVTKIVSARIQRTPSPTSSVHGVKRRAVFQKRAVEAADINADVSPTMGKSPPHCPRESVLFLLYFFGGSTTLAFIIFLLTNSICPKSLSYTSRFLAHKYHRCRGWL